MGKYREINPSEKELPDLKEVREKSLEKRDLTYLGKNTEKEISEALSKNGEENYKAALASVQEDVKSVINWMRKHMETYPETRNGFLIRFIDDNGFK